MKKNKEEQEERETPIRDGDARPDQGIKDAGHPGSRVLARTKQDKKQMTKERGADVNSLEDYRDAK